MEIVRRKEIFLNNFGSWLVAAYTGINGPLNRSELLKGDASIHRPLNRSKKGDAGIQGPLNQSELLKGDAGIEGPLNQSELLQL